MIQPSGRVEHFKEYWELVGSLFKRLFPGSAQNIFTVLTVRQLGGILKNRFCLSRIESTLRHQLTPRV